VPSRLVQGFSVVPFSIYATLGVSPAWQEDRIERTYYDNIRLSLRGYTIPGASPICLSCANCKSSFPMCTRSSQYAGMVCALTVSKDSGTRESRECETQDYGIGPHQMLTRIHTDPGNRRRISAGLCTSAYHSSFSPN
jgi:hypothetical protein